MLKKKKKEKNGNFESDSKDKSFDHSAVGQPKKGEIKASIKGDIRESVQQKHKLDQDSKQEYLTFEFPIVAVRSMKFNLLSLQQQYCVVVAQQRE